MKLPLTPCIGNRFECLCLCDCLIFNKRLPFVYRLKDRDQGSHTVYWIIVLWLFSPCLMSFSLQDATCQIWCQFVVNYFSLESGPIGGGMCQSFVLTPDIMEGIPVDDVTVDIITQVKDFVWEERGQCEVNWLDWLVYWLWTCTARINWE